MVGLYSLLENIGQVPVKGRTDFWVGRPVDKECQRPADGGGGGVLLRNGQLREAIRKKHRNPASHNRYKNHFKKIQDVLVHSNE